MSSAEDRRRLSEMHPDSHMLTERAPGIVTTRGSWRRVICWVAGTHGWTEWHAGASGWPTRRCGSCGARQVRMDASW